MAQENPAAERDTKRHRIVSAADQNTLRIGDTDTGQPVALTPQADRILHASQEAWRNLGWLAPDPDGKCTRYPAEIFGALPP